MGVAHAAVFTNAKAFAGCLQLLDTGVWLLTALQAFGSIFMSGGHGAVALHVFFDFFVAVLSESQRHRGAEHHSRQQSEEF
jgi:hypothetical protein